MRPKQLRFVLNLQKNCGWNRTVARVTRTRMKCRVRSLDQLLGQGDVRADKQVEVYLRFHGLSPFVPAVSLILCS